MVVKCNDNDVFITPKRRQWFCRRQARESDTFSEHPGGFASVVGLLKDMGCHEHNEVVTSTQARSLVGRSEPGAVSASNFKNLLRNT